MSSISVIIGTYGEPCWPELALERAVPTVTGQIHGPVSTHLIHGATLAEARNQGADAAKGEWLCFLDADDELDQYYLAAMANRIQHLPEGKWLLQPASLGVVDGVEDPFPTVIPRRALIDANYLIIGTLVRRDQFLAVGGFDDWPYAEDWDLWLRCWIDGAESIEVPDAIYRVHVNTAGRNNCNRAQQVQVYNQIRNRHTAAARLRGRG